MGTPRRPRKKYETPEHPWRKERIEAEKLIVKEYGLKNKKELYKMDSKLRGFYRQARLLISKTTEQSKKEEKQLLEKIHKYNMLEKNSRVEDVLNLKLNNIMDRRLQTLVYKQGLAKSINQARQFIVHGHIFVSSRKVDVPSYLVTREEENKIYFDTFSTLANPEHAERAIKAKPVKQEERKHEKREDKKERPKYHKEKSKEGRKPRPKKEIKKKHD